MSLKQIIRQGKILSANADLELELPGEPMIYSIKYPVGSRIHPEQFFRNNKWRSMLKCYFKSYFSTKVPVVILVRFYVTPEKHVKISKSDLCKEKTPAVHAFELCDYLLSFLEMLMHVLINSYAQIVKIETEKYYSMKPRTVFKFMKWTQYEELHNNNTVHTKS